MPEYDAFGREIGEDPLALLRRGNEPAAPADRDEPRGADDAPQSADGSWVALEGEASRPTAESRVARADAPRARPIFVRPRRRGRFGGILAIVVVLVVAGAIGGGSTVFVDEAGDVADPVEVEVPDIFAPEEAGPRGLERGSLVRVEEFAQALATLREAELGRPEILRLAPARIDAGLDDGRVSTIVQLRSDHRLRRLAESQNGGRPTIEWNRIDPAAPQRLVRAAARRIKRPVRQIDYLVLNREPVSWGAYFRGGKIVIGDEHGRVTRVL